MTKKQKWPSILERIACHLIMHSSHTLNPGLYHGKMGVAIFFAHYGRYTGDNRYDDFMGDLLDEISNEVYQNTPVNFESGLCGIGWGLIYLMQNGFVKGEPDEVLLDFDKKIMGWDLQRVTDMSIKTGLEGMGYYIDKRLSIHGSNNVLPFDERYLSDWEMVKLQIVIPTDQEILSSIYSRTPLVENILHWKLGIENGCAGYGLTQMLI